MKIKSNRKGFTLIELLVVIAIIAVLAVVVILSLNPAELLRQARDSNRVSDMATLKSAISLYLADVTSPNLASSSLGYNTLYISGAGSLSVAPTQAMWGIVTVSTTASSSGNGSRAVDSTGWIPVAFSKISSGAPLGSLPVDPTNSTSTNGATGPNGSSLVYGYIATSTGTTFKLMAHMESIKCSTGGSADVETNDGGLSTSTYEQGTNLTGF